MHIQIAATYAFKCSARYFPDSYVQQKVMDRLIEDGGVYRPVQSDDTPYIGH